MRRKSRLVYAASKFQDQSVLLRLNLNCGGGIIDSHAQAHSRGWWTPSVAATFALLHLDLRSMMPIFLVTRREPEVQA